MTQDATEELLLLIERWTILSEDPAVPAATRRILRICLDDVRLALASELPSQRPLGDHLD